MYIFILQFFAEPWLGNPTPYTVRRALCRHARFNAKRVFKNVGVMQMCNNIGKIRIMGS
jgi:hypothetical protein